MTIIQPMPVMSAFYKVINMGKIISICAEKGGAGKTVTATNLAVLLSRAGQKVALVDADPQFSLSSWAAGRAAAGVEPAFSVLRRTGDVLDDLLSIAHDCDYLIIDTGGRDSQEMREALVAVTRVPGSAVIAPMQPAPLDLQTAGKLSDLLRQVEALTGHQPPCYTFVNRAPTQSSNRDAFESQDYLRQVPGLYVLNTIVRDRAAQRRDALLFGMACIELPRPYQNKAMTSEWVALFEELFGGSLAGTGGVSVGFDQ